MQLRHWAVLLTLGTLATAGCTNDPQVTLGTDAKLKTLTVTVDGAPATLSPAFASDTRAYGMALPYSTQVASVTVVPSDSAASNITVTQGSGSVSASSGTAVSLELPAAGASATVNITVTAQDQANKVAYTLTLTRATRVLHTDAALASLTVTVDGTAATLSPAFASGTLAYSVALPYSTQAVSLTAVPSDSAATGLTVTQASGTVPTSSGAPLALTLPAAGATATVHVTVTAEDGSTHVEYTLTLARATRPLHTDAALASLTVTVDGTAATLSPAFASGTAAYSLAVPYSSQAASLTVVPADSAATGLTVTQGAGSVTASSGAPLALTLPAAGATATVHVTVTAEDGVTQAEYTIELSRVAGRTDSALASLVDSAGALTFVAGTTTYAYTISAAQSAGYAVTPTAADSHASIKVNGVSVASGAASGAIDLALASGTVTVVVTAEDGVHTTSYTLNITVSPPVAVTGLSLSRAVLRLDTQSSPMASLGATVTPADATDRVVLWNSADPSIATVDASGNVTAKSAGQTTVTATSHDGSFPATCTVYVFTPWFSDDFETGTTDKWTLLAANSNSSGPNGAFSIADGGVEPSTKTLKYTAASTGGVLATVTDAAWSGVTTGDYYVEARIKPQTNSTTGNKQLYLIARYQDASNWYAAGLNVQNSSASTQVEIAKMAAGSLSRPGQVKKPIVMDTTWYTVRFELVGSTLTVYLDGELVKQVTDTAFTAGKIGLFTANKSFELDDVRVGDPKDRPSQLTISPAGAYSAEAGDPPRVITVTAKKPDYGTGTYVTDTFTVTTSDASVVPVQVTGTSVTLNPLKAGTATITFTSDTTPSLTRTVVATIAPGFVQPTTTYDLTGRTSPVAGDSAAYVDTRLTLTLDSPPTLGTTGSVRIFRKSDDVVVDVIKLTQETNAFGYTGQDQLRVINVSSLVKVAGNVVTITPHTDKLAYGTEYYVAIGDGVLTGASLAGTAFTGIGRAGNWSFVTRAAPLTTLTSLTVDDDGPADFRTVQGALNYFMKNAAKDTAVTVNLKNGTYEEALFLRAKNNVSIIGESRTGAVIQYRNHETLNSGSGASQVVGSGTPAGGRAVFLMETSDLLTLDTLTLSNTTMRSAAASAQAETIYFNNDTGRLVAKHANFTSEQDTLQLKGYAWFYQSLVAGNVDFIWGNNRVSLFEESEIRSLGDSTSATSGGYVVQARTVAATDKGFVFLNSTLTHGVGPGSNDVPSGASAATYLARSPGGTASFDNVAFVSCKMDNHVIPVGWAYNTAGQPVPNPATATAASGWREYGTTDLLGTALDLSTRAGGYALTASDVTAGFSSRAQIFSAFNSNAGWAPAP